MTAFMVGFVFGGSFMWLIGALLSDLRERGQ